MYKKILIICSVVLLAGCAATQTMISKGKLNVQTKMSNTVFLNPVEDSQKTIYVQIKNTSDKPDFKIDGRVKNILANKGYRVVTSLNKAHYLLQANILQVGKVDPSAAEKMFLGGYGSSIQAIGAGVAVGALAGGSGRSMFAGGLIGGIVDTVANAAVKDVTYTVVTDLQISEKAAKGASIKQTDESEFQQGTGTVSKQYSSSQAGWMKYQTRIMSTANKVNLKFKDALPLLEEGLSNSIAGIF